MGRACEGTSQNGASTDQDRQRLDRGNQDATYTPNTSQPDRVDPAQSRAQACTGIGGERSRLAQCMGGRRILFDGAARSRYPTTSGPLPDVQQGPQIAATAQAGNDM